MPTVEVQNTQIFYTTSGTGLPCLVMHGGLGLDHTYLGGLDSLSDVLHLIYYDHRHNGRSGRPPLETVTHAQLADDAEALRQHLGLGKVAVLGHSYGGFIALEYALRHPDSVSHLILLDTAPAFNYGEEIMDNARAMGATPEMLEALGASSSGDDEAMKNTLKIILPLYFHRYQPAYAALLADSIVCAACEGHQEKLLSTYNTLPHLHEIGCPTLILVGRHDFICPPSQAQLMHASIAQSRLLVFENSGHFPWIEEPELFMQTVKEWLEQAKDSPPCRDSKA
jgi:proline iminopeptidase